MTNKRTDFALNNERDMDLLKVYKDITTAAEHISLYEVLRQVVESPSARFWVSETRATRIITKMIKGKNPHIEFIAKREMYGEIYKRVVEYRKEHPKVSIRNAVAEVIREPAPKFYMSTKCAEALIHNARLRERKKQKKLFGLFWIKRKDEELENFDEHAE